MGNFDLIFYLIISLSLIILTSLCGIFFLQKNLKTFLEKNLHFLVSFSSGVFCFLTWEMFWESTLILNDFRYSFLIFLIGFCGISLISKIFPQIHQHHDSCCQHSHQNKIQAKKVLIGDALHNIGDGIILATSFLNSFQLGMSLTISIIIHEILQEISEFFVLKEAGYSTKKALFFNFLISFTIILGVLISFLFSKINLIKGFIIGLTAGIFLNLIINDLIPHNFKKEYANSKIIHTILIFSGIIFMFLLFHLFEH